jgi:sn1-specific diacylglycerol lipase
MSLNEIAVDLTCDPMLFSPACEDDLTEDTEVHEMPGFASFQQDEKQDARPKYQVHSGMLRMSRMMGGIGRPVHLALKEALKQHRGYGKLSY